MSKNKLNKLLINALKKYKKEKEEEGYVPTIEMLIEDLAEDYILEIK